jgi:hypothetical protein
MSIFGKITGAIFCSQAEAAPAPKANGDVTSLSAAAAAGSHVDVTVILGKAVAETGMVDFNCRSNEGA